VKLLQMTKDNAVMTEATFRRIIATEVGQLRADIAEQLAQLRLEVHSALRPAGVCDFVAVTQTQASA
jgi:hypothetical protein